MSQSYILDKGIICLNESLLTPSDWDIITNYHYEVKHNTIDFTNKKYNGLSYEGLKYLYLMADYCSTSREYHIEDVPTSLLENVIKFNEDRRKETENWKKLFSFISEELHNNKVVKNNGERMDTY